MKKFPLKLPSLFLLAFIVLPAAMARAGSVDIYSTDDSGAGSLRWAINITNSYGGANTINWIYGSGGTLTLLSDLPAINGGTTLDATHSIYDAVIADSTNSMSLGGAVTFLNDSISSTFTIHEDIGGAGSLIKTGDGVLVLTGTNTYTAGTFINGGILATNWDGALGVSGGLLSFDGGTLQALNDLYSSRPITLNSGGGTFDTNSYLISLSGIISGAGSLYKTGGGTLILGAANTYQGTTTLNAGTLQLEADNALPQDSTVTVAAGATLDLGGHIQTIASYSGSGTLAVQLQKSVTNLNISGTADISGSSLHIYYTPQIIDNGETFTPISADSLTGTFSAITSPAAVLFTPAYNTGSLVLTASLVPFASIASDDNQKAVGAALEPLRASPTGDIAQLIGKLYTLDTADLQAALDQLGPVPLMSMRGLAYSAADITASALKPRLAEIAAGGGGGGFSSYYSPGSDGDYVSLDEARSMVKSKKTAPPKELDDGGPWGFFASATGGLGETLTHKDGEKEGPGYTFSGGGLVAGTDYRLWENVAIGALGAYTQGQAGVYDPSKATVNNTSARYGLYAAAGFGSFQTGLYAGKAQDSFDTARTVSFADVSRKASASPSGRETSVLADAAYDFGTLAEGGITAPYLSLAYNSLKTDPFTEKGADSADLAAGAMSASSLRSTAGLRFSQAMNSADTRITATFSAGWSHEFKDQDLELDSSLAGGAPFSVYSGDAVRDALKLGARLTCEWEGGISTYLEYAGDLRRRYHANTGSAGISFQF